MDGLILDDSWSIRGPSEEDKHALEDTGLAPGDVTALILGWQAARNALESYVDGLHKYIAPTYGGDALSWYLLRPINMAFRFLNLPLIRSMTPFCLLE